MNLKRYEMVLSPYAADPEASALASLERFLAAGGMELVRILRAFRYSGPFWDSADRMAFECEVREVKGAFFKEFYEP